MSNDTISPRELQEICAAGEPVDLIDVRTPAEFNAVHALPARNVPLDSLDATAFAERGRPLYVICKSGARGRQACQRLREHGVHPVFNVEGGTEAWERAGLQVVRGRGAVSLERQVRIAAGTLVVVGAVLAVLVHPYWIGLSAFVGAGLIFAGITDSCGMGLMLARMPWNR